VRDERCTSQSPAEAPAKNAEETARVLSLNAQEYSRESAVAGGMVSTLLTRAITARTPYASFMRPSSTPVSDCVHILVGKLLLTYRVVHTGAKDSDQRFRRARKNQVHEQIDLAEPCTEESVAPSRTEVYTVSPRRPPRVLRRIESDI